MFDRYPIVRLLQVLGGLIGTVTFVVAGIFYMVSQAPTRLAWALIGVTLTILILIVLVGRRALAMAPPLLLSSAFSSAYFSWVYFALAQGPTETDAAAALYWRAFLLAMTAILSSVVLFVFRKPLLKYSGV
jgi:hypothetical protein